MSETVLVSTPVRGVRLVQINRPERRNALNVETIAALGRVFSASETDDDARCIVLTGDQRAFSAGADIAEMSANGFATLEHPKRRAGWSAIERYSKPLVAAAEGLAFGGGLELLLLADIVVAGHSTRLGLPETRIGLIPGDGGTQRLTRLIGRARATRMIFTGEPITADEAGRIGLISDVVDDLCAVQRALEIAEVLANSSLPALRMAKAAIAASAEASLYAGLGIERNAAERVFASPEGVEGLSAFLEKRKPQFLPQ